MHKQCHVRFSLLSSCVGVRAVSSPKVSCYAILRSRHGPARRVLRWFFARISTQELVRLMMTCRRIHHLIMETCFSVPHLLAPFFGDAVEVQRFRSIQAMTDTVISGSIVLQFMNRLRWPGSDLDIYIHRTCPAIPVGFIVENGYTFDPRESQNKDVFVQLTAAVKDKPPSYLGRGIADVLDFHKGEKKIQIIIAESTPMEIIISFHSTCVMNILTHKNAYALYPRSTFITKEALVVETVGAGQEGLAGRSTLTADGRCHERRP
ncbi:hypothetical protein C8R47DRAFT_1165090 [Mycena vitilis]|nr:hypothetical protein C8R47DRAFT_1165090 [Mycena vitilis]